MDTAFGRVPEIRADKVRYGSDGPTRRATLKGLPFSRYVYPAHYEYWAALSLPVVVCRPVLATGKVYWLPASAGRSSGKMIRFQFAAANELTSDSAVALRELARREGEVFDILSGAAELAQQHIEASLAAQTKELYATVYEKDFYARFDSAQKQATAVFGLVDLFPGLVTDRAKSCLAKLEERFNELLRTKTYVDGSREG